MDTSHLIEQADRCRRLAATVHDERLRRELVKLEKAYQQRAEELSCRSDDAARVADPA